MTRVYNHNYRWIMRRVLYNYRWIMRGFSGYFPPTQLLYLWDLVIAYDSMEVKIIKNIRSSTTLNKKAALCLTGILA